LYRKEIDAPFKPKVKNELDVGQIDPVFTQERAMDSLVESTLDNVSKENQFDGFTYVAATAMDGK
jgi:serum/glucocorticoid-regulated kinase 2